jgi:uncharacterized protein YutE (UPF0331/DUF86 family)
MDRELLSTHLSELDRRLALLEPYRSLGPADLDGADERTAAIERHPQIAIQSALDAAGVIITGLRLREPRTYAESFEVLSEAALLEREHARRLSDLARFRNILVHGYLTIDPQETARFLREGVEDLREFIRAALAASGRHPGRGGRG